MIWHHCVRAIGLCAAGARQQCICTTTRNALPSPPQLKNDAVA